MNECTITHTHKPKQKEMQVGERMAREVGWGRRLRRRMTRVEEVTYVRQSRL